MQTMTLLGEILGSCLENRLFRGGLIFALSLATIGISCKSERNANPAVNTPSGSMAAAPNSGYQIVKEYPHDPEAYTQGLIFADGSLLESTGRTGQSTLRRVELQTGKVLERIDIPRPYFAEGLAQLKGKLYQLTWQHGVGFIYDSATFAKLGEFKYSGEGWGLTTDGQRLILSDGTNVLRFFDPEDFKLSKTIAVLDRGRAVMELNELEFVQGEVYANVWHNPRIARIDPQTGRVKDWIDLTGLRELSGVRDEEGVLNGIAYDETSGRLFVTGKLWPKLFEIRLKEK